MPVDQARNISWTFILLHGLCVSVVPLLVVGLIGHIAHHNFELPLDSKAAEVKLRHGIQQEGTGRVFPISAFEATAQACSVAIVRSNHNSSLPFGVSARSNALPHHVFSGFRSTFEQARCFTAQSMFVFPWESFPKS